jgi:hypothetical protein
VAWGGKSARPHAATDPGRGDFRGIGARVLRRLARGGRVGLAVDGHPALFCFAAALAAEARRRGHACRQYAAISSLDQILASLSPSAGPALGPGLTMRNVLSPRPADRALQPGVPCFFYNVGHLFKTRRKEFDAFASRLARAFGARQEAYLVECVPGGENTRSCRLEGLGAEMPLIGVNATLIVLSGARSAPARSARLPAFPRARRPAKALVLAAFLVGLAAGARAWTGFGRGPRGDEAAAAMKGQAADLLRHLQTLAVDELSRPLKGVTPWWNARPSRHGAVLVIEARELPLTAATSGPAPSVKPVPADPWQTTIFVAKKPLPAGLLEVIGRVLSKSGGSLERTPLWTPEEFSRLTGAPIASPELKKIRRDLRGHQALIYRLLPASAAR